MGGCLRSSSGPGGVLPEVAFTVRAPWLAAQDESVELSGAGGALQFAVPGHLFARLEVATPLSNRPVGNDRDPQFYFRLGASF